MPQKRPYGEPTDSNSLLYLRARYYHPAQGVFTARDPFEGLPDDPLSINGYNYVHGNPINLTDPSGENPLAFLIPIVAPVVGIILAYEVLQRAFRGLACLIEPHGTTCKRKTVLENVACGLEELLKPRFPNIPVHNPVGSPIEQYPISTPEPGYYPFPISTPVPGVPPYPISTPIPGIDPFPGESPINNGLGSNLFYSDGTPNLSVIASQLSRIFKKYPSTGFKCVKCADKAGVVLQNAGYEVDIVRLENKWIGARQPPYIPVISPTGKEYNIAETGFHEVIEIAQKFYIDSLVYEHFGVNAVAWDTYMSRFLEPSFLIRISTRKPKLR